MDNIIEIFENLEANSSRNYKEELLYKNKNNDLLKLVFVITGDPYANFYIKKWKMPTPVEKNISEDNKVVHNFIEIILEKLSTRKVVGNEAKFLIEETFKNMDSKQQKWCSRILLRNLRVGVMETTVNKIWPNSISKFSVQLAESLDSHHEPGKGIIIKQNIDYPIRSEPKLDGLRCIAVKHNKEVKLFTRSGSLIETLPTIKAALENAEYDNFVFDGECLGKTWNDTASVMMSYKSTKDDKDMIYHVFDAMHFNDWKNQESSMPLIDRIALVANTLNKVNSDKILQVPGKTVHNENELLTFYAEALKNGHEGIMLKILESPYQFKRTNAVLKLKPVATTELVIVGHYEGNRGSKHEGLWGGFEAMSSNGVVTKVGGGFSDKIRAEVQVSGPDSFIGKVVECEYQPDPTTDDGFTSDGRLRFPVFCRFRDIRDVVDEKIKKIVKEIVSGSAEDSSKINLFYSKI